MLCVRNSYEQLVSYERGARCVSYSLKDAGARLCMQDARLCHETPQTLGVPLVNIAVCVIRDWPATGPTLAGCAPAVPTQPTCSAAAGAAQYTG